MIEALIYGLASGFSLLIGVIFAIKFGISKRSIAKFIAFGSGVLICALTFGLMDEAFSYGGFNSVIIGFSLGGLGFIVGDYFVHIKGGRKHLTKPIMNTSKEANGKAITLGAILDGIPESVALGVAISNGHGGGILMVTAIVLSNFPEGLSSVSGLRREGFSKKKIINIWLLVAIVTTIVTLVSYYFFHNLGFNIIGIIEAFAAGAILAMLADTMMPEAFDEGGFTIGALTVAGFLTAFIISKFGI